MNLELKTIKNCAIGTILLLTPLLSSANSSINEMQSCQGLLDFIEEKLDSAPAKYPDADVSKIRDGLDGYNNYIQTEIITPGLLAFNSGDASKARGMQQQIDTYKKSLVNTFQSRYPENRIYTDQAVAVNNCAKKAVPSGQALKELTEALNTMVKLAKMN